jgi:cell division protein FtsW (lipid II flippase)
MSSRKESAQAVSPPVKCYLPGITLWVGAGFLLMLGARVREGRPVYLMDLLPLWVWWGSGVWLTLCLKAGKYQGVRALPALLLMLSGVGVWMRSRMLGAVEEVSWLDLAVYPASMVWVTLAWMGFRRGRFAMLRPLAFWTYLLSVAGLGALLLLGSRFRGAVYAPGGMTPTELLKILLPVMLAGFFARTETHWQGRSFWHPPGWPLLGLATGAGILAAGLVVQRDLGMLVLLGGATLGLLVMVTGRWNWLVAALIPVFAGGIGVRMFFSHGQRRIDAWLNPFEDPTGAGWQVLQGLSGLYAGGVVGTGLGEGRPDRLPIAGSDFIYAVYGEEMGFLGCLLLLVLYGLILRQGFLASARCSDPFSRYAAFCITLLLAVQIGVNLAGVVTLLPVTGIPLPWLSLGGSSAWVTAIQFGWLMALSDVTSAHSKKKRQKARRRA